MGEVDWIMISAVGTVTVAIVAQRQFDEQACLGAAAAGELEVRRRARVEKRAEPKAERGE